MKSRISARWTQTEWFTENTPNEKLTRNMFDISNRRWKNSWWNLRKNICIALHPLQGARCWMKLTEVYLAVVFKKNTFSEQHKQKHCRFEKKQLTMNTKKGLRFSNFNSFSFARYSLNKAIKLIKHTSTYKDQY